MVVIFDFILSSWWLRNHYYAVLSTYCNWWVWIYDFKSFVVNIHNIHRRRYHFGVIKTSELTEQRSSFCQHQKYKPFVIKMNYSLIYSIRGKNLLDFNVANIKYLTCFLRDYTIYLSDRCVLYDFQGPGTGSKFQINRRNFKIDFAISKLLNFNINLFQSWKGQQTGRWHLLNFLEQCTCLINYVVQGSLFFINICLKRWSNYFEFCQ